MEHLGLTVLFTASLLSFPLLFFNSFILYFWPSWVFVAVHRLFSSCGEQGLLFIAVGGLRTAVASLVAEHELYCTQAPVAVPPGF